MTALRSSSFSSMLRFGALVLALGLTACDDTSSGGETGGDGGVNVPRDGGSSNGNLCGSVTCMNGGVCDRSGASPVCVCLSGYSGPSCSQMQTCTGVATACSLRSSGTCSSGIGCFASTDTECTGVATSCYSRFSSFSCTSGQGCTWNSSTSKCSGSAWSCSLYSSGSCYSAPGCSSSSTSTCEGTALACSSLTPSTCPTQPGCSLN